jgi:hypothetical protein
MQRSMGMRDEETRRINVVFPVRLLEDLDRLAPPRKRGQIIVAATAEYVRRLKLLTAIKETAGAWGDESHPELSTPEDIDRWLRQIRATWRREPLL